MKSHLLSICLFLFAPHGFDVDYDFFGHIAEMARLGDEPYRNDQFATVGIREIHFVLSAGERSEVSDLLYSPDFEVFGEEILEILEECVERDIEIAGIERDFNFFASVAGT